MFTLPIKGLGKKYDEINEELPETILLENYG